MKRQISRRLMVAGTGALLLPSRAAVAAGLVPTPAQTEGPFYPAALPIESDSDLVQVRGSSARAMGIVLHLQGRVLNVDGKPMAGAAVAIWQSDSQGLYDHPRQSGRERRDAAFQGYGRLTVAADGRYAFRTLKPVAYPGRAPHIHFKVATVEGRHLTSQFYLAGDALNAGDFVYRAATRDARQQKRIDMHLQPAPGLEDGAFVTTMEIVAG